MAQQLVNGTMPVSGPMQVSGTMQVVSSTLPNGGSQAFIFPNNVQQVLAIVSGFSLQYQDGIDHNVKSINVNLSPTVSANTVNVQVTAIMQDNNNHLAPGTINFQLLAFLQ